MKAKSYEHVAVKPRIVLANTAQSPSAALVMVVANTAWNLAHFRRAVIERLVAEGFRVVAAAAPDGSEQQLAALGAEFRPLPLEATGRSPLADLKLLAALVRLLREVRPRAMLSFTVKPNIYGALAARLTGTPAISTVTGLGSSFLSGGALEKLVRSLYRLAFSNVRAVMFQNSADREHFVRSRLVAADRARVIGGSGIDLERFRPEPLPEGKRFTFLLVGRVLRDKGVVEYADAARILRDSGVEAVFRIVGDRRPDNPSVVPEREVERWIADDIIEHHPPVDDIRPQIAAADCLVLPSYREGLPRSLLEGMAMARPLVASDVPGCNEVVENGVNGLLCEPRSAASLAEAMRAMLGLNPAERQEMGRRGRMIAEARFDEKQVAAAYMMEIAA